MSKVLFIDDDEYDSRRARKALEAREFEVTYHQEALPGLAALKGSGNWSTVVLDLQMPVPEEWQAEVPDGLTGLKILKEARVWIIEHRIPVLIYTNRGLERVKDEILALNIPPDLLDAVEKVALRTPAQLAERVWLLAGSGHKRGLPDEE